MERTNVKLSFLKNLCIIALLICLCLFMHNVLIAQNIIIQFQDHSGYKGSWDLNRKMPLYIKKNLSNNANYKCQIIKSYSSSAVSNNQILLNFKLLKFRFYGYNIANYRVGGYNNNKVEIVSKVTFKKGNYIKEIEIDGIAIDSNLGLTMLGGPGGDADVGINPYIRLQKLRFGSRDFNRSLYGKAMKIFLEKIKDHLSILIKKSNK